MKWASRSLAILGTIFLIVALIPYMRVTRMTLDGGAKETKRRYTFGIPASQLVVFESSESTPSRIVRPDGGIQTRGEGFRTRQNLEYETWSMLSLILGVLLLGGARRWVEKSAAPK